MNSTAIATGASGQVFRGQFKGEEVAIKVMINEEKAEFHKEVSIMR